MMKTMNLGSGGVCPQSVMTEGANGGGGSPALSDAAGKDRAEERPDYVPEKYWRDGKADVELLGRSYQELERKFSSKFPQAAVDLPTGADGYALRPDELPAGLVWSDEAAGRFSEVFHKNGVGQTAARAISDAWMELEAENLRLAGEVYERQLMEADRELRREWSDGYEARLAEVRDLVVNTLGEDADDAALFSNPKVVRFLGRVAEQLGEDAKAAMKGAMAGGHHFSSGAEEAKRIMRDVEHPEHAAYVSGDRGVIEKVRGLIERK